MLGSASFTAWAAVPIAWSAVTHNGQNLSALSASIARAMSIAVSTTSAPTSSE